DQFAETMQTFGLGRSLEAEGFSALFDTRWPGSPMSFDLSQLDGRLTMKLGKGRVLDVDPGAGRLFGLLSFTTLPRRLRGDFADLNEEGFVFDSIEGDFDLVNGVATTENLKMVGPAAKLDIRGEVDLKNETVDQIVDVIPEVSSTLPLAGVLAGGVGVGAALLVIQQVLNDPLNRLAKFSYHMHGPWAEPVIDKLNAGESSAGRSGVNPSDSADAEKPAKSSLEAFEVQN
ncbi:MAG: AsmA-like C-terminal region-containing protein, partial [Gammaproteobacteria bacterium]